jgi:WD40 repeat protein
MTRGSLPQGVFPLGTEVVTLTPRRPRSSDADPFSGVRGVWSGFREQLEEIGREGIGQPILGVAADADGSVILTAGWDGLIKVWRGDPPRSAGSLTGHDGPVTSVVVDAGGGTAASGGSDGTVRLWDVTTSREIGRPLEGGSWVRSVDLSERWMVSGGDDHVVRLWDRRSGRQVAAFTCDARISVCTLADDNVVAGDDAGGIHVLAIETGSGGPAGATTGSRRATSGGRSRT